MSEDKGAEEIHNAAHKRTAKLLEDYEDLKPRVEALEAALREANALISDYISNWQQYFEPDPKLEPEYVRRAGQAFNDWQDRHAELLDGIEAQAALDALGEAGR